MYWPTTRPTALSRRRWHRNSQGARRQRHAGRRGWLSGHGFGPRKIPARQQSLRRSEQDRHPGDQPLCHNRPERLRHAGVDCRVARHHPGQHSIVIENGIIARFKFDGINSAGARWTVDRVHAVDNGRDGLNPGDNAGHRIHGSTVAGNGRDGIRCTLCIVSENIVGSNGGRGIAAFSATVLGNFIEGVVSVGLLTTSLPETTAPAPSLPIQTRFIQTSVTMSPC
jgi:hypothetical protein